MKFRVQEIEKGDDEAIKEIKMLCEKAGLPRSAEMWGEILSIFSIRDQQGSHVATARLEIAHDHPFVEAVAVRADFRKKGLGKKVVKAVMDDAKKRGINTIWVMTRAPEFFKAIGFQSATDSQLSNEIIQQECMNCSKYLSDCHPMLMWREIDA